MRWAVASLFLVGCADTTETAPAMTPAATAAMSAVALADQAPPPPPAMDAAAPPPALLTKAKGPEIGTTRLSSAIYEKPSADSAKLGTLRVGSRVLRSAEPVPEADGLSLRSSVRPTSGKWYAIEPRGYVCDGTDGVTTNLDAPEIKVAETYPLKIGEPFPVAYATSYGSPLYARIPTADEQHTIEGDVAQHIAHIEAVHAKYSAARRPPKTAMPSVELPAFLKEQLLLPSVSPEDDRPRNGGLTVGWAWPNLRFSLLAAFDAPFEGQARTFYLTSEHHLVPANRFRAAKLCDFQGIELAPPDQPGEHLPLAWVNWHPVALWKLDEAGHLTRTKDTLPVQAHAMVLPEERAFAKERYVELASPPPGVDEPNARYFVPSKLVMRAEAATELPPGVAKDELWIDVNILRQTLVMYKGLLPVYATLVSSGVDGAQDIEKTKSTPRGAFRIMSKHLTGRMAADEQAPKQEGAEPDPRYRIDDVPYIQYFHRSYALHGAYWHDAFGQPKSHGCINLSPRDALYLFGKTSPSVPPGWHSVQAAQKPGSGAELGTMVNVHIM